MTVMTLTEPPPLLTVAVVSVVVAGVGVGRGVGLGSRVLLFVLVNVPEMGIGEIRKDR